MVNQAFQTLSTEILLSSNSKTLMNVPLKIKYSTPIAFAYYMVYSLLVICTRGHLGTREVKDLKTQSSFKKTKKYLIRVFSCFFQFLNVNLNLLFHCLAFISITTSNINAVQRNVTLSYHKRKIVIFLQ